MLSGDAAIGSNNPAVFTVALRGVLEVANIETLYRRLEQALTSTKSTVVLDAEEVEHIDGASLQLLAVFHREVREQGYTVQWDKPSMALQRSARLAGLADWLGLNDSSTPHE